MTLLSKTYWGGMPFDFRIPPTDATVSPVKLRTQDFRDLRGLLWGPASRAPRAGALLLHPRVDFTRHYAIPRLVAAGFEAFDFVFLGIVLWQAWKMPAPVRLG